jgi:hypothetical protein
MTYNPDTKFLTDCPIAKPIAEPIMSELIPKIVMKYVYTSGITKKKAIIAA